MNDRVKAGLIALATIVGAFTAVAQFLDYLTSAKAKPIFEEQGFRFIAPGS